MKLNQITTVIVFLLYSITVIGVDKRVSPYKILNREELGSKKLSLDVQVGLVDGRLPNEQELGEISIYLVSKEKKHDRTFVLFYLPGMKVGSGAFASAHHNPTMEVKIMKFMLQPYSQYRKYLK